MSSYIYILRSIKHYLKLKILCEYFNGQMHWFESFHLIKKLYYANHYYELVIAGMVAQRVTHKGSEWHCSNTVTNVYICKNIY